MSIGKVIKGIKKFILQQYYLTNIPKDVKHGFNIINDMISLSYKDLLTDYHYLVPFIYSLNKAEYRFFVLDYYNLTFVKNLTDLNRLNTCSIFFELHRKKMLNTLSHNMGFIYEDVQAIRAFIDWFIAHSDVLIDNLKYLTVEKYFDKYTVNDKKETKVGA